jgi:mono/diheme cytochrome c family protein
MSPLIKEGSMKRLMLAFVFLLPAAGLAADGKATYDKMCASCHGADGKGNAEKAKVLKVDAALLNLGRPEGKDLDRDKLKQILVDGKGKMPPYGKKLKPDEVDPVLDYSLGLAKAIRGD